MLDLQVTLQEFRYQPSMLIHALTDYDHTSTRPYAVWCSATKPLIRVAHKRSIANYPICRTADITDPGAIILTSGTALTHYRTTPSVHFTKLQANNTLCGIRIHRYYDTGLHNKTGSVVTPSCHYIRPIEQRNLLTQLPIIIEINGSTNCICHPNNMTSTHNFTIQLANPLYVTSNVTIAANEIQKHNACLTTDLINTNIIPVLLSQGQLLTTTAASTTTTIATATTQITTTSPPTPQLNTTWTTTTTPSC